MSQPGCPEIAFFGNVSLHGQFRTFGKTIAIIGVVLCVAFLGYSTYATSKRFRNGFIQGFKTRRVYPQVEIVLLVISMALIGTSIYLIKRLIQVNDIQQVDVTQISSVSQLIPLLVGGFGCGMTVFNILSRRLFMRKRCWYLFGYHL